MSIVRTAVLASLLLTASCAAQLIAPPAVGAGVGALVGGDRRRAGAEVSITTHTLVGAVAGFLVDAIAIAVMINQPKIIYETPGR